MDEVYIHDKLQIMDNQTAMQKFIAWGDEMLLKHPQKILSFGEAIDKAVELLRMEKEQIKRAYIKGGVFQFDKHIEAEQYYNETYKKK